MLGGAAVTEEIVPGFRFSVASYVVSLLRPEIIRELDLPRHGLEILPLDGTFTPLDGRLPVARQRPRPHGPRAAPLVAVRRRGLRGVRPADGRDGPLHQADPVDRAARPGPHRPAPVAAAAPASAALRRAAAASSKDAFIQLMTMSAADFLDQWFETDPLKATMSASGIIGTFQGVRSPGHGLRAAAPLHGRDRRGVPRLGHPPRRHRRRQPGDRIGRARRSGAEIRTEAPVARIDVAGGTGDRRHARVGRGARWPTPCSRAPTAE